MPPTPPSLQPHHTRCSSFHWMHMPPRKSCLPHKHLTMQHSSCAPGQNLPPVTTTQHSPSPPAGFQISHILRQFRKILFKASTALPPTMKLVMGSLPVKLGQESRLAGHPKAADFSAAAAKQETPRGTAADVGTGPSLMQHATASSRILQWLPVSGQLDTALQLLKYSRCTCTRSVLDAQFKHSWVRPLNGREANGREPMTFQYKRVHVYLLLLFFQGP